MKYLLLIAIALLLNGCLASSYKEMINKPNITKKEYVINQNYQKLYKTASGTLEDCYESGYMGGNFKSRSKIFPQIKEAKLYNYADGAFGKMMAHAVSIKAIDNNTSSLTIYSEYSESDIEIMKKEFTGECTTCRCETIRP